MNCLTATSDEVARHQENGDALTFAGSRPSFGENRLESSFECLGFVHVLPGDCKEQ